MQLARIVISVIAALAGGASAHAQYVFPQPAAAPAVAPVENGRQCLDEKGRRQAIADKRALPLATAIRRIQRRPGELVNARLCQDTNGLVYVLTLLPRDGKVTRATVDASNGRVISGR